MIDLAYNTNINVYAVEVDDSKIRAYKGFEETNNLDSIWWVFLVLNLILVIIVIFTLVFNFLKKV
jgi:hypothetical protein